MILFLAYFLSFSLVKLDKKNSSLNYRICCQTAYLLAIILLFCSEKVSAQIVPDDSLNTQVNQASLPDGRENC